MKQFLGIVLLVFGTLSTLWAQQDGAVSVAAPYKIKDVTEIRQKIGSDDQAHYFLRKTKTNKAKNARVELQSIDKKGNLIKIIPFDTKIEGNATNVEHSYLANNQIYLVLNHKNLSKKRSELYLVRVDPVSLKSNGLPQLMAEMRFVDRYSANVMECNYHHNKQHTKLMISYPVRQVSNEPLSYYFMVFDMEGQLEWQEFFQLEAVYGEFELNEMLIDSFSNVYLLGQTFQKSKKKRGKFDMRDFEFTAYKIKQGNKPKKISIRLKDKIVSELKFETDNPNQLRCVGFYGTRRNHIFEGVFSLTIDTETGEAEDVKTSAFEDAFFVEGKKKKTLFNGSDEDAKEIWNVRINSIVARADGGRYLLAEQNWMAYTQESRGGITTHFFHNDIIVVNLDKYGDILWVHRILKRQHTYNDFGRKSSFAAAVSGESLCLVFNDDIRNVKRADKLNEKNIKDSFKGRQTVIAVVYMDKRGNQTRGLLDFKKKPGQHAILKGSMQTSPEELMIYTKMNKVEQLLFKKL